MIRVLVKSVSCTSSFQLPSPAGVHFACSHFHDHMVVVSMLVCKGKVEFAVEGSGKRSSRADCAALPTDVRPSPCAVINEMVSGTPFEQLFPPLCFGSCFRFLNPLNSRFFFGVPLCSLFFFGLFVPRSNCFSFSACLAHG